MKILILGQSGCGKSNLSDLIKNAIFKADSNAFITVDDPDRESKVLGEGSNEYDIIVKRDSDNIDDADIVVEIKSKAFIDKFMEVY